VTVSGAGYGAFNGHYQGAVDFAVGNYFWDHRYTGEPTLQCVDCGCVDDPPTISQARYTNQLNQWRLGGCGFNYVAYLARNCDSIDPTNCAPTMTWDPSRIYGYEFAASPTMTLGWIHSPPPPSPLPIEVQVTVSGGGGTQFNGHYQGHYPYSESAYHYTTRDSVGMSLQCVDCQGCGEDPARIYWAGALNDPVNQPWGIYWNMAGCNMGHVYIIRHCNSYDPTNCAAGHSGWTLGFDTQGTGWTPPTVQAGWLDIP
jgi:hypothetical protein